MKRSLLALGCLAISTVILGAESADLATSTLTLPEAIRATLKHNPELGAFVFQSKALEGEKKSAALKPAYRLTADLDNVAGTGEMSGIDSAESTLGFASILEPVAQRNARVAWVSASQQQLVAAQRVKTLEVVSALTQDYVDLLAGQAQLQLQESAQAMAETTVKTLSQQAGLGKVPQAELLRAKAALARAHLNTDRLRQQWLLKRNALAQYWGQSEAVFSGVAGDLMALPSAAALPQLQNRLKQNPDLEQLNALLGVREAELRKAQSQAMAGWEWRAGLRQFQSSDDLALVMGLSLPLGTEKRAQGAISTASFQRDEALYQRDKAELKLLARLDQLHQDYQNARQEVHSLQSEVLPLLQEANRETRRAFEYGRYGYLELQAAQTDLLSAQQALIDAALRAQYVRIAIERLTGADLGVMRGEKQP